MIQLTRQSRLFLPTGKPTPHSNRWSSLTRVEPLRPFLVFDVTVAGEPCSTSGYIVNIRQIDHWVQQAISEVDTTLAMASQDGWQAFSSLVQCFHSRLASLIFEANNDHDLQLVAIKVQLSPYLWLTVVSIDSNPESEKANAMPETFSAKIQLTQQFEFSAAHRLHCDRWTEQQNQEAFGKCNHPNGHGHNYLLDVTVEKWGNTSSFQSSDTSSFQSSDTSALEECVNQVVIEKLDHRFLNLDVAEFRDLNPTVENISQVIFRWLEDSLPVQLKLAKVRVYETAKTWAEVTCN